MIFFQSSTLAAFKLSCLGTLPGDFSVTVEITVSPAHFLLYLYISAPRVILHLSVSLLDAAKRKMKLAT